MATETPNGQHDSRTRTDKSLRDERVQTDQALANRVEAMRSRTDAARHGINGERGAPREKASLLEARTREQRRLADTAVSGERQRADQSIDQERKAFQKAQMELINRERLATDAALSYERQQIDAEIERCDRILLDEQNVRRTAQQNLAAGQSLLAIVSHDLRSPLSAIAMSAELLAKDPHLEDPESNARKAVAIIARSSMAALRLINDLMDAERIASGRIELDLVPTDLGEFTWNLVNSFRLLASHHSINLAAEAPASALVLCDPARITQVLSNLLANAIKFTPHGGSVVLEVKATGRNIRISVTDTGPGIPEVDRQLIFERFSQLQSRDRTGLGLGLYIAKSLLAAHGSELRLQSTVGTGSSFSFELPRANSSTESTLQTRGPTALSRH